MCNMGNLLGTRKARGSIPQYTASGGMGRGSRGHGTMSKLSGKGKNVPLPPDTCYRCGKVDTRKARTVKLWMQCVEVVAQKDTLRRSVSRLNVPQFTRSSTSFQ